MTRGRFRPGYAAWLVGIGAIGWALVVSPGFVAPVGVAPLEPGAFVLFLALGLAAALLSIELRPGISLAVDAVFFAAAAVAIGPYWTVRAWAIAAALHFVWVWHRRPDVPVWGKFLRLVYQPGLAGGTVVLAAAILGLGPGPARALPHALWLAPLVGALCLVLHYSVQLVGFWLQGFQTRELRDSLGPALALELAMLPVSSALVYAFPLAGAPLAGFTLVAGTYLLIHFALRIAIHSRERARQVEELESLAHITRNLSTALDLADLIPRVRDATLTLLPADRFVLVLPMTEGAGLRAIAYDREGRSLPRSPNPNAAERAVLETAERSRITDVARMPEPPSVQGSWMGFPLIVADEAFGVVSVESDRAGAFDKDDERRGAALAAQASIALENARLYALATVDGLTGLYVRRYFDQRVAEESIQGRRDGTPFCVIMLDLDDFSDVNDGHGHAAGDDILRGVARAMRVELRGSDVPARHGGEEFAVLLPRTELVEAAGVAERILEGIRNTCISVDGKEVRVTASVGVAEWSPHLSDVVARADDLLYVAKRAGKDAVALDGDPEPELVRPSGRGIRRRTSPIA